MGHSFIPVGLLLPENSVVAICPLNWGLGHASRCIPIIQQCILKHNKVIVASDGIALEFLKNEFPNLTYYELPAYGVRYPYGSIFKNLLTQSFRIWKAILSERQAMNKIIDKEKIHFVLSDNRYGLQRVQCPSVFLCHQVYIHADNRLMRLLMNGVNGLMLYFAKEIWVPDMPDYPSLGGKLTHTPGKSVSKKIKYIGPQTNLNLPESESMSSGNLLILLSGPEPQRSLLENQITKLLPDLDQRVNVCLIRGSKSGTTLSIDLARIIDLADRSVVAAEVAKATAIVCRSGYSTLMDLASYKGKVLYIPTPGQTEQEYLARLHADEQRKFAVNQSELSLSHLEKMMALPD